MVANLKGPLGPELWDYLECLSRVSSPWSLTGTHDKSDREIKEKAVG